jgi:4-amino-4-deoxy-L-arabinose transferase-like glycosyltransferase
MKKTFFLLGVFVLKLIVALQLDKHPLLQPDTGLDTTAYVELAKRVAAGDFALGPGLYFVSPLYIYFLALFPSLTAARVAQALLGTIAVALIYLTAREWYGRRAAEISAVLAGLCGVFAYYEGLLLQSSLDVFLTALALWLLSVEWGGRGPPGRSPGPRRPGGRPPPPTPHSSRASPSASPRSTVPTCSSRRSPSSSCCS